MDAIKIGRAIKKLRTDQSMTQSELAQYLNVTDKAVSKWERGIGIPDVSMFPRLASILNTDVDNLLEGNITHLEDSWKGMLILDDYSADARIYGKPSVYFSLCYFLLAGIKTIDIYCKSNDAVVIEKLLGNGMNLGISIHFADLGILEEVHVQETMIVYNTPFVYGPNLTRYFQRAISSEGNIVVLTVPYHSNGLTIDYDNSYKVIHKTGKIAYTIPFSFIKSGCINFKKDKSIWLSEKITDDEVWIEPLGVGMLYKTFTNDDDILDLSLLIKSIECIIDSQIYNINEVAYKRGLISRKQCLKNAKDKEEYKYLQAITKRI